MWKEYRTVVFRFLLVPYIVNLVIFSLLVCKTVNDGHQAESDEEVAGKGSIFEGLKAEMESEESGNFAFKESKGGNILLSVISLVFAVLHVLIELKMLYEYRKAYFYAAWNYIDWLATISCLIYLHHINLEMAPLTAA